MRRCHGVDLAEGWDPFELTYGDDPERCPNPATMRFFTESEWIPLCAEHYDQWILWDFTWRGKVYRPDETLPIWQLAD